jgi:hypothetical protein
MPVPSHFLATLLSQTIAQLRSHRAFRQGPGNTVHPGFFELWHRRPSPRARPINANAIIDFMSCPLNRVNHFNLQAFYENDRYGSEADMTRSVFVGLNDFRTDDMD